MWCKELIIKPDVKEKNDIMVDHPLSQNQNSKWNTYFKDLEIQDEIEKDVKRTRTDLSFFYMPIDPKYSADIDRIMRQAELKKQDLSV